MTEAAALARRYPNAKVLFTGGSVEILREPTVEADAAGMVLRDLGVGGDRLLLERKARNTAENAVLAKQLADPKPGERWLLVTSAWHMPRAMGLFRKVGFDVEPWPSRLPHRRAAAMPGCSFASPVEGLQPPRLRREGMAGAGGQPADRALRRAASRRRRPRPRPASRTAGRHRPP